MDEIDAVTVPTSLQVARHRRPVVRVVGVARGKRDDDEESEHGDGEEDSGEEDSDEEMQDEPAGEERAL